MKNSIVFSIRVLLLSLNIKKLFYSAIILIIDLEIVIKAEVNIRKAWGYAIIKKNFKNFKRTNYSHKQYLLHLQIFLLIH
jgi:hypothetical protein